MRALRMAPTLSMQAKYSVFGVVLIDVTMDSPEMDLGRFSSTYGAKHVRGLGPAEERCNSVWESAYTSRAVCYLPVEA